MYRKGLIAKVGIELVEWLEGHHEPKKYTVDDLQAIKAHYTALCKQFTNDGTEASGQRNPSHAGTPSPYEVKDAQVGRVKEKQCTTTS